MRNRTSESLVATYQGRTLRQLPAQQSHSIAPTPLDEDCLIGPVIVLDESDLEVARVDQGECLSDHEVVVTVEPDDLP